MNRIQVLNDYKQSKLYKRLKKVGKGGRGNPLAGLMGMGGPPPGIFPGRR